MIEIDGLWIILKINIVYNSNNIILFFSISILATHQKGFIFYILSSHVSFLLILKIYHVIWPFLSDLQKCSYRNKLFLFILSLTCMSLMAYFYYRHFIHCDPFGKLQLFKFRSLTSKCYIMYWWLLKSNPFSIKSRYQIIA
mgnify:CR=1 FL=1